TRIGGQQNSVVLQKLKPDTPYTITLSSLTFEYCEEPQCMTLPPALCTFAGSTQSEILTSSSSFMHPQQVVPIPVNTNDAVHRNLQPDAPDTVTVVPLYPEGDGGYTPDTGRTWKRKKYMLAFLSSVVRRLARDVQVYSPTPNSWDDLDPAPGRCRSTVWCALPWLARGPRNLTMQQTEESESLERQPSACPRTGITLMGQLSSKGSFFVPPLVTQLMNM
ncbi:Collagen alpha-1 chain, partial [Camelus dromedarius]